MQALAVAPTAEVLWEEPVEADGDIYFTFKGHTTSVPVTTSSNIVNAVINGVNNDSNADMTATGGGGNKIIFESKTAGTTDNGEWIDTDFQFINMDPNNEVFSAYQIQMVKIKVK